MVEDIEHLLEDVSCGHQSLKLAFDSEQSWAAASNSLKAFPELLLVTSHWGCNDHGSRLPYV